MFHDKVVIQVLDEGRHVVVCFAVSSGVPLRIGGADRSRNGRAASECLIAQLALAPYGKQTGDLSLPLMPPHLDAAEIQWRRRLWNSEASTHPWE